MIPPILPVGPEQSVVTSTQLPQYTCIPQRQQQQYMPSIPLPLLESQPYSRASHAYTNSQISTSHHDHQCIIATQGVPNNLAGPQQLGSVTVSQQFSMYAQTHPAHISGSGASKMNLTLLELGQPGNTTPYRKTG